MGDTTGDMDNNMRRKNHRSGIGVRKGNVVKYGHTPWSRVNNSYADLERVTTVL